MYRHKEICCFCLSTSNDSLIDLLSKSTDNSTYFDKISSSLFQLTNVLNELNCHYLICSKCCNTIEIIYEFNRRSLHNVKTLSSCREKIKTEIEEKISNLNVVPSNTQQGEKISLEIQTSSNDARESTQVSVKREVENVSNFTNICQVDVKIEESDIKMEDFDDLNKSLIVEDIVDHFSSEYNIEKTGSSGHVEEKHHLKVIKEDTNENAKHTKLNRIIHKSRVEYTCNVCGKMFGHKGNFDMHMRIHTNAKPFVCSICDKSFNRKAHLDTHMLIHTDEKPYVCNLCNKAFRQISTLNDHKIIHNEKKPYFCTQCDKTFTLKRTLVRHYRLHKGIKGYTCDICNRTFANESNFIQHGRLHTGEKPYVCAVCKEEFAQRTSLIRHKKMHRR